MEQSDIIQRLLLQKHQRQNRLNKQFKELEELELELSGQQFGRFFGTSYLVTKRLITLILGLIITAIALLFLIQPDLIFEDTFMSEVIQEEADERMKLADEQIEKAWKAAYTDGPLQRRVFAAQMEPILNFGLKDDFDFAIHFWGYAQLIIGIIILYVSRLTRKMWVRNNRITHAQGLTKELIDELKTYIQEDEEELATLQGMVNETKNP